MTRTLPKYLTPEQVNALIDAASAVEREWALSARVLMMIQWRAGLRVSEALALTQSNLDWESKPPLVMVRDGKGGKDRSVPMHPELQRELRAARHYLRHPDGHLFTVSRITAWRWVQKALKKCWADGTIPTSLQVGTHTLRHSCARHWVASKMTLNQVQLWMGHEDLSTTGKYLKLIGGGGAEKMDEVP
ncbi:MAG: tyrosine-type recombinase/integrase [Dehalococcoidia bacterium]|nr:tyrosine-type recombinase/integrase [Dehalococcoidia bacterium]